MFLISYLFLFLFNFFIHSPSLGAQIDLPNQAIQRDQLVKTVQEFNTHFKNIIFDTRASRGGNGDVAEAYLTIMDFLLRLKVKTHITMLVDNKSKIIIERIAKNNFLFWASVQVETIKTLKEKEIYDLYIVLANPTGAFKFGKQILEIDAVKREEPEIKNENIHLDLDENSKKIKIKKEGVLIVQTVLGNTENMYSIENSEATIRSQGINYKMSPAGLDFEEMGIYYDFVALQLKEKTLPEVTQFILSELDLMNESYQKQFLQKIMKFQKSKNTKMALVYGITSAETHAQFEHYLQGLLPNTESADSFVRLNLNGPNQNKARKQSEAEQESVFLITPSSFDIKTIQNFYLREKIIVISQETPLHKIPETPEPGKIYIFKTQTLPHKVFVGLLAYSMKAGLVPLGAEDGFMSAALNLGGPFAMTRVPWNIKNIMNLSLRLEKMVQSADPLIEMSLKSSGSSRAAAQKVIEKVFTYLDLSQAQNLKK